MTINVLFLCTGNSARSIMAEAILNHDGGGKFTAFSAGADPAGAVSPFALQTLERHGYPHEGARSKSWEEFTDEDAPQFDYVITVCGRAKDDVCPLWRGGGEILHWPVTDPVLVEGNQARMQASFEEVFGVLKKRIGDFINSHTS